MRFRRLMAASMAGVMAVSSAIVCQISASAEDIAIKKVDANKIPVSELTDVTQVKVYLNFTSIPAAGSRGTVTVISNGGVWKQYRYATEQQYADGTGQDWQAEAEVKTTGEQVATLEFKPANWGYEVEIKTDNADFTPELTKVEFCKADGTVVKTYDPNAPSISQDNFTVSNLDNTNMAIGDSFTIAYDSTNTPANAKYTIKATYDADKNDFPTLVKDDGTVDNSSKEKLGIEVSKATSGSVTTYTFTAVSATAKAYTLGVEITATGNWTTADTKYPWFGGNIEVSVASADVAVESVTLDQTTATIQKGKTLTLKATVLPADATDATVTWTSSKTDVATVDSDGVVTAVAEGTAIITAKAGEKSATCTVTVDKTDAELIAAAKTAAETELGGFSATNSTTPDNIGTVVSSAVLNINNDIEVTVNDADFQITKATEEAAGSITGKVTLKKGTETAEVTVSLEIAKLPVDDASRVAAAKTATEKVLSGITATNDTKEADVLAKITEAISDTKATAAITGFKVTPATSAAAGSVTGTVTLTSGTESDTVAINLPIAQLEKTDAEKLADAKKVAQTAVAGAAKAEDITEAAIKTAVNNADVAVKVESKVTKEATTTAEGETTVTVTLTVGTETDTVTRTFPIEKLTEEKPVTSDALWEGSVALGNWANSVQISGKDFTNFGAGTFVIELAPETGAQVALKYTATDWPVVPGCEEWYDVSGTKFEIEVTAEAMKAVGTNTLIVGGKNATIKKVTFVPAKTEAPEPDTTVEIDTSTTPVTKIESVDTKTDASGKVTEQIAYCAISEADAKNYDSYIVTITRGKDSKKFTQVIEDCFKAVQYESKDGKTVQVNAKDGSYCVLLDITGIGSDFGGITVTIAPNA